MNSLCCTYENMKMTVIFPNNKHYLSSSRNDFILPLSCVHYCEDHSRTNLSSAVHICDFHKFTVIDEKLSVTFSDDNKVTASAKNTKASLGVEVLYGTFKKWGYQTFFQEDLCWYDIWGSALTDIGKRATPQSGSEFRER